MNGQQFNFKFFSVFVSITQTFGIGDVSPSRGLGHVYKRQASAQPKIAVLVPEKTALSQAFAEKLETSLAKSFKVLDASLSETAYRSANYEKPFNLSLAEAKNIGAAVGCDYFLLVKADTLRRYSFEKKEFHESYAAIYAVSSRTGFWMSHEN